MKLSIIIPVYNTEHVYLRKCLSSILKQDCPGGMEVLCCDDGSTNGCGAVLRAFASKDRRIKVLPDVNKGTSAARNRGLDNASGEYVMFVDSDDWLEKGCIEAVVKRMEEAPVDLLFFGYATNYTNRRLKRILEKPDKQLFSKNVLELALLKGNPALGPVEIGSPWGKLIRRDVIEKNGVRYVPGLIKGQDTVFVLNLMEKCSSFAYFPFLGYNYRISERSVSHRYNERIIRIMEATLAAYRDFTVRSEKGAAFKEAVDRKYLRVLTGEYMSLYYIHPGNPRPLKARMKSFRKLIHNQPYRAVIENAAVSNCGLYEALLVLLLKGSLVGPLFFVKAAEEGLRRLAVRNYG